MFDSQQITPPPELVATLAHRMNSTCEEDATEAYRAGAQFAADALRRQWPEPITDRAPTKADADENAYVQACIDGRWVVSHWRACNHPWLHTTRYRPTPPPNLREQTLARFQQMLSDPNRAFLHDVREAMELAVQALTEQGGEVEV